MNLLAENSGMGLLVTLLICGVFVGLMFWIKSKKKPDPRRRARRANGNGVTPSGKKATGTTREDVTKK